VPSEVNTVKDIIDIYEKKGEFNFKGSILNVSALDGSITWNGRPIVENNFYDHWIKIETEITRQITSRNGEIGWTIEREIKIVLSTIRPKPIEILRNFYHPEVCYRNIFR